MAKYTIQIPTVQFGLIAVEIEGNHEDAVRCHNDLLNAYQEPNMGLGTKEWQQCLDRYVKDEEMDSNCYERMSLKQKGFIQELKRSIARIQPKEIVKPK